MKKRIIILFCVCLCGCTIGCSGSGTGSPSTWIASTMTAQAKTVDDSQWRDMSTYQKRIEDRTLSTEGREYIKAGGQLLASAQAIENMMGITAAVEGGRAVYDESTCYFDDNGLLCVQVRAEFDLSGQVCRVEKSYYYDTRLYRETTDYDMGGQIQETEGKTYFPAAFLAKLFHYGYQWNQEEDSVALSGGGLANGEYETKAYEPVLPVVTGGYYWSTEGRMVKAEDGLGPDYTNKFVCTGKEDYIPVSEGDEFRMNFYCSWIDQVAAILFLDSNDAAVSSFFFNTSTQMQNQIIRAPRNAAKMHVSMFINQTYEIERAVKIKGADLSKFPEDFYQEQSLAVLRAGQEKALEKDKMELAPDKAYITFVLDDCRPDMDEVANIFAEKQVPLCIGAIYNLLPFTTSLGNETRKQVCDRVVANGGEVLVHDGAVITEDKLKDYDALFNHFYKNKMILEEYGYDINGIILAGGTGAVESRDETDAWTRQFYRYSDLYGKKEYGEPYYHRREWLMNIKDNYKERVVKAIADKEWVVFYLHDLKEVSPDKLREMLDYVKSFDQAQLEVVNYKTLHDRLMPVNK